jgi:sodium-dependent dicarboxylate transporter 2/3/5
MVPVTLVIMAVVAVFMYFFMRPEVRAFRGSQDYYRKELEAMGPMAYEEKVVFFGFLLILLLALTRPLYVDIIKGPYFKWLHPSPLFFIFAALLFFLPSRNGQKENILSLPILVKHFPMAIVFIWTGAVALGRLLTQTGASKVSAQWLQPLVAMGDVPAIAALTIGPNLLSQAISDTATAGVMIPLVIESMKNWQGMQQGAVPFIWVAGAALSWSFAVASSTGAQGIVAGFGANLGRMFVYGMYAAILCIVTNFLYFVIAVSLLKMDLYILLPAR